MLIDYASNFTFPWSSGAFDVYDIPDALNPESPTDASKFLNDGRTRSAIHAPTSKDWALEFKYPFDSSDITNETSGPTNDFGDPSVEPMAFFTDLLVNASQHDVRVIIYSGNDDMILPHRGSEVVIQNTTWGGTQGFIKQPSRTWTNDRNETAGVVHQERNLTYVLLFHAGHEVPLYQPENAFVFLRDFVFGSNTTGSLDDNGPTAELPNGVLDESNEPIFFGSASTVGSTVFPTATIASWESFITTHTSTSPQSTDRGDAKRVSSSYITHLFVLSGYIILSLC